MAQYELESRLGAVLNAAQQCPPPRRNELVDSVDEALAMVRAFALRGSPSSSFGDGVSTQAFPEEAMPIALQIVALMLSLIERVRHASGRETVPAPFVRFDARASGAPAATAGGGLATIVEQMGGAQLATLVAELVAMLRRVLHFRSNAGSAADAGGVGIASPPDRQSVSLSRSTSAGTASNRASQQHHGAAAAAARAFPALQLLRAVLGVDANARFWSRCFGPTVVAVSTDDLCSGLLAEVPHVAPALRARIVPELVLAALDVDGDGVIGVAEVGLVLPHASLVSVIEREAQRAAEREEEELAARRAEAESRCAGCRRLEAALALERRAVAQLRGQLRAQQEQQAHAAAVFTFPTAATAALKRAGPVVSAAEADALRHEVAALREQNETLRAQLLASSGNRGGNTASGDAAARERERLRALNRFDLQMRSHNAAAAAPPRQKQPFESFLATGMVEPSVASAREFGFAVPVEPARNLDLSGMSPQPRATQRVVSVAAVARAESNDDDDDGGGSTSTFETPAVPPGWPAALEASGRAVSIDEDLL